MNMNAQVSTEQSKSTLIGRLADRLIAGQYQMAVKSLQLEAPDALEHIIAQADPGASRRYRRTDGHHGSQRAGGYEETL